MRRIEGKHRHALWLCHCDCGNDKVVSGDNLQNRTKPTKSCGCLKRECDIRNDRARTHGESHFHRSNEYVIWTDMRSRCNNPQDPGFANYGGRGIRVCDRWESYQRFLEDVGRRPSSEYSLERINNDGDYEPGNVKWATRSEQSRNKRSNRILEFNGQIRCLAEWSDLTGINSRTLTARIRRGWDISRSLTTPVR